MGGKGAVPQFVRRRVVRQFGFKARVHVDAVDALAVAGVGEANRQFARVILGLAYALGQRLVPRLRCARA